MEGRFVGTYAEEALKLVLLFKDPSTIVVDLSEVNFVDEIGEDVLSCLGGLGVKFVADGFASACICNWSETPSISVRQFDHARSQQHPHVVSRGH